VVGEQPLAGRTVVVTRAAEQAGRLTRLLEAAGATVVEVPVTQVVAPADEGAALREAVAASRSYDWLVLTSPNGVAAVAEAAGGTLPDVPVAVVGPGTADAASAAGGAVALVPDRFVAEGLLDAFPDPPPGGGRVLLAQAEAARPVLAEGLRERGWDVVAVVAYRTVPCPPDPGLVQRAARADAITFTAGSGVHAYVDAAGAGAVPPTVVCIGPVTAAAAEARGLKISAVARTHDLGGLVQATVDVLNRRPAPGTQP